MSKILNKEMWSILYDKKSCFQSVVAKLKALNPTAILHRGYSICVNLRDNKVIKKLGDANDKIRVIICDGILICDVKEKLKKVNKMSSDIKYEKAVKRLEEIAEKLEELAIFL